MKKLIYLFLFSLLVTLFAGCSKESVKEPQTEPEEISAQLKVVTKRAVLYANNFNTTAEGFPKILGNATEEDSFLNWCKVQGFTEIRLSSISTILKADNAQKAQLNQFVGKAQSAMYGLKVHFGAASSNGVNDIGTYCANYPNKPDGIISEYEFWNAPNSFDTFKTILTAMTALHNTYPSISRNAYVRDFKDDKGVSSDGYVTRKVLENCETVFLVNYYTNAYDLSPLLKTKLKVFGDRAKQNNKVGNVIILFTVHPDTNPQPPYTPDIYSYFSTNGSNHKFKDAYNNLMADYNAQVDENKDGLSFKGYAIFHHTDARQARP